MKRYFLLLLSILLVSSIQFGEISNSDGPYLFWREDRAEMVWIDNGQLNKKILDFSERTIETIKIDGFDFSYRFEYREPIPEKAEFQDVSKFFAIADVHGQFSIMAELLQAHHVINKDYDWSFGSGHLIILGDIFDRGPQVTDCLWLIHQLEWQAIKAGGYVHFLLGNHELMVLQDDLRYVHSTYLEHTEAILGKTYHDLFAADTEFGRWLRTKNTVLKLNDFLFVHAGISPDVLEQKLTINNINSYIRRGIASSEENKSDDVINLLLSNRGPLWYRGFFREHISYPLIDEKQLDKILSFYQAQKIITAHTTMDSIVTAFNGKAIGIDAGLKRGVSGEALFYHNGTLYRALLNGVKQKM